jgi:hypothetical protein
MQLFKIDEPSAQRLIASVPLLLTQQVTAAEAEACAQALRMLGARVVVEPTPLPSAQHARWQQPGGYEEDLLPQPRMPVVQNDNDAGLEYDVLGSPEPSYAANAAVSVAPASMRSPVDMELGTHEADRMVEHRGLRRPRQESIDLGQSDNSVGLELAAPSAAARERQRSEPSARVERPRPEPRAPVKQTVTHPAARPKAVPSEPAPHGRASVVQHAAVRDDKSKTPHLLQLLFALAVAAMGYWLDSSIVFGSAGVWSIAAHGVALYQMLLGIRGLVT